MQLTQPVMKNSIPLSATLRARRYLIASAASILVIVVMTLLVIVPRVQSILAMRDDIAASQKTLTSLEDKERFLETFKNAQFLALNDKLEAILPSTKPFLQTLYSLQQLAIEQNVQFVGLDVNPGEIASAGAQISPTDARTGLQRLELRMKVDGTSAQISSFVNKVTSIAPAVDVKSFKSQAQAGANAAGTSISDSTYEADIDLDSLYAPIFVSNDSSAALPQLSKTENDYATSKLPTYVLYPATNFVAPDPSQLGKPDPFAP